MSVNYSSKIPAITEMVQAEATKLVHKATLNILSDSRTRVPVKTGNLKNSGRVELSPGKGVVTYSANYAYFVEGGTRSMAPKPYLRPAFNKYRVILLAQLKELIK